MRLSPSTLSSTICWSTWLPADDELVLYDINRRRIARSVLISDPGPLTVRLMDDEGLPFALTLITNENGESTRVVTLSKAPMSSQVTTESMDASWPVGMISLSHVAYPFRRTIRSMVGARRRARRSSFSAISTFAASAIS